MIGDVPSYHKIKANKIFKLFYTHMGWTTFHPVNKRPYSCILYSRTFSNPNAREPQEAERSLTEEGKKATR
jgi:hypothetical protein